MHIKTALQGAWVTLPAIALDRITKILTLEQTPHEVLIPGVLGLRYAQNTGAAFSMFSDAPWLVNALSIALVLLVTIILITDKKPDKLTRLGLWLVVAGGLGNIYDRFAYGYVVDMIEVLFMDFAIFNVADVFVCGGAFLAAVGILRADKKQNKPTEGT